MTANIGQQSRLASKLKRNLDQVFLASEGFTSLVIWNGFDYLVSITDIAGNSNFLIKFKAVQLESFAVPGLTHHKILLCSQAATADIGIIAEVVARVKELGCGIEVYQAAAPLAVDVASEIGLFSGAATYHRFVRGSVDMINVGQ